MSIYTKLENFYENTKENALWHAKHSNPLTILSAVFNKFMDAERGTEMPYYFPGLTKLTKDYTNKLIQIGTLFAVAHESELNSIRHKNFTNYDRLNYFARKFYFVSNPTVANLYYQAKLDEAHYQRVENLYKKLYLTHFAYNVVSGTLLVACANHYFRSRKATLPTVLLASVPVFASLLVNYNLSDGVKNYFLNNYVRRLGYGYLTCNRYSSYPRNVDFTD